MTKILKDLSVQEVLALAIQSEEEDGRIYADLAKRIVGDFPDTAKSLLAMHDEEDGHRHRLISLYRERFGEHIPLIRRQDVKGFITRKPLWINAVLTVPMIRREVETMEEEPHLFGRPLSDRRARGLDRRNDLNRPVQPRAPIHTLDPDKQLHRRPMACSMKGSDPLVGVQLPTVSKRSGLPPPE